jgi:hypothetical protein
MNVIDPNLICTLTNMNRTGKISVKGLLAVEKLADAFEEIFREIWEEYWAFMFTHVEAGYHGPYGKGFSGRGYLYDGYSLENSGTHVCIRGYWSNQSGGHSDQFTIPVDFLHKDKRDAWFDAYFLGKRSAEADQKVQGIKNTREAELKKLAELQAKYPEVKNEAH